jgi:predicted amidophosphoribosyltransferase
LQQELCQPCAKELQLHDYRSRVGEVPIFSSLRYGPKAGHILLAAKEDGVRKADDLLVAALVNSFRSAVATTGIRPALVPIPHRNKALRKRGRDFVAEIAGRLATREALPLHHIIRHNRKINDQSLMDVASRFGNLAGAMSVTRNCGRPCEVFLVDDLMTTGATLSEAVRALEKEGFHVVAAVTALVALPLR